MYPHWANVCVFAASRGKSFADRRRLPAALFVPLALGVFLLSGASGFAQTPGEATSVKPSKEVLALFDMIDDIDWLRNLNPLKLKPDQMERLSASVTTVKADYDKKAAALATIRVAKMGEEIRAVKKKVLAGAEIPTDFETKIKKL